MYTLGSCAGASRRRAAKKIQTAVAHGWSTFVPPFREDGSERDTRRDGKHRGAWPCDVACLRHYHTSLSRERSGPAIFLTLGAVAATAKAGQYAVQGYNQWRESVAAAEQNQNTDSENQKKHSKEDPTAEPQDGATAGRGGAAADDKHDGEAKRENIFASFFNMSVGSKYYEGGFEDAMTRKEAALILGVRESSAAKRIKEAHRKLLILNHPDTGGSTYLAGKINEAKELLLKGRAR